MPAPASKPEPGTVGDWKIDPGTVELIDVTFTRRDFTGEPERDATTAIDVNFEFNAVRATLNKVGVVLTVKIHEPALANIEIQAGTVLTFKFPEDSAEDIDRQLADIAAQMGPVIIYPYIRELVADLTRRAGLKTLTLPIYQIGTFFKIEPKDLERPDEPKPAMKAAKRAAKTPGKKPKTAKR